MRNLHGYVITVGLLTHTPIRAGSRQFYRWTDGNQFAVLATSEFKNTDRYRWRSTPEDTPIPGKHGGTLAASGSTAAVPAAVVNAGRASASKVHMLLVDEAGHAHGQGPSVCLIVFLHTEKGRGEEEDRAAGQDEACKVECRSTESNSVR